LAGFSQIKRRKNQRNTFREDFKTKLSKYYSDLEEASIMAALLIALAIISPIAIIAIVIINVSISKIWTSKQYAEIVAEQYNKKLKKELGLTPSK